MFKTLTDKIPVPFRLPILIGAGIILLIALWFYGTTFKNHISNTLFQHKEQKIDKDVQKQLAQAAEQKKELDKTLLELKQAREDLDKAKAQREQAEVIFNDKFKTATQKLADYKTVMSDPSIHTDPTGVTTDDLCERAKQVGSDQAVIDALCTKSPV